MVIFRVYVNLPEGIDQKKQQTVNNQGKSQVLTPPNSIIT